MHRCDLRNVKSKKIEKRGVHYEIPHYSFRWCDFAEGRAIVPNLSLEFHFFILATEKNPMLKMFKT